MSGTIQDVITSAALGGGFGGQMDRTSSTSNTENQTEVTNDQQTQQQQDEAQQQLVAPGSMDEKSVKKFTEELNKSMERVNSNLSFKYHKEVNMMSVAVVDKTSGKIIKELPPEEMVNNMIKSKIWIGAFLDKIA